ncbi:UpxY family transcription antiterminator [Muribaculum intestinale]|uniref:UpxY family transcription antiterminator n=1 Tax=Muribaculum intestinale TaxID=1796646 RepID=UPI0025A94376|nr:UpxY family transcription antiterminator [Muribaculum intestinale]
MDETCVSEHQWFVMRDLKRPNAKLPAYKELAKAGFRVFTPLITKVVEYAGKRKRVEVPFVQDLLFVFSEKETLDKVVARTDTLQYRFVKGAAYCSPMVVSVRDMERFIAAVSLTKTPQFYSPDEISPNMFGATVRVICEGPLNGFEGVLLKVKGSGKKKLIVKLPGLLAAAVEVGRTDYVELID